ncbi:MAG: TonB-dependent receptor [Ignavibacterium sp.]|jgi:outer membrane receptor for ferrienterochelin and colicin|nr:TonB-dependent receptor [Ignavibacterium sp.]MDX9713604.1 TonB-dependent receptor [Ignavibacteriaceae bacterium]
MKKIISLVLLLPFFIYAGTTGKLAGTIKDAQTGEPLVGANVIIEGTNFGAATNLNGEYVILNISPGRYNVKFSFIGYETIAIQNVIIVVDQTTLLQIELNPQTIQVDEIVVTARTPLIQKDVTGSISVITREEIDALPVSTFTELLSLQAGVTGSGSNLHVRGGRSNEVAYMIDGTIVVDPLLGGLATDINNDAIQEMSLLSGTFNAEYGNALSGVVNIVTRDGSDKFSAKLEARTSEFGIDRYTSLHENRINGSISGPIVSPEFNFFLSGEVDKHGSYLPFGYNDTKSFFSKLTTNAIPFVKISLSNRGSVGKRQNYSHSYKYIPEQYLRKRTDSWQSTLGLTHTIANNFFYDVKASYFNQGYYSGIDKDTADYLASNDTEYFEEYGTGFEFYKRSDPAELYDSRSATADFKADAVWQMGSMNEVKFGAAFKKHWLKLFYVYDPKRNFPYLNDYHTQPFEGAAYVQDKIELPYLVINIGLRFDYLNSNVKFRSNPLDPNSMVTVKSRSQISPRFGIAHPISDRTKLHFSYGHFFQNPDFEYLFENNQYDLNVREPLFGQPDLDAQRTISYEVGLSHQFSDNVAMNLTAYYRDITGLIGTRYYFPFVDGRYTGYTLYVNEDYANIRGFELTVDVRPNRYFSGGLTYTYSIAKGSASSETEQYPGTEESTQLYYLDFDRPHVFNASGTYTIPKDDGPLIFDTPVFENMDFSIIFKASSGAPYTPSGRDIGFVEKNSLRQPGLYNIDLMIGKEIEFSNNLRLRLFAEILNLTDHRNILYVYGDTGDPSFTYVGGYSKEYMQDPSNFGPPRSIRLGFTLRFN